MAVPGWVVGVIFVAAIIALAIRKSPRLKELARRTFADPADLDVVSFAKRQGWQYVAEDRRDLPHRYQGQPFQKGVLPWARSVLSGEYRGRRMVAFEYIELSDTVENSDLVVTVATPGHWPTLEVRREGLARAAADLVGVRDLQLESAEFNNAFLIAGADDRFAYDVLNPRMMQWLLADSRSVDLPFRFENGSLLVWRLGLAEPAEITRMLDYACDILDRVPAFVWKD